MAVYFLTGKLGSGKTLCAVGKIRDYLEQGRPVATNLDLNLDELLPKKSKQYVTRLPDKPRLSDLEMLGKGCVDENETMYGAIVLDELGTWFNTRNWNDKSRLPLIDWFLHARKLHWDVFFIVQDIENVDKQLRNSLCEHLVVCKRTDRLTIPIIGPLIKFIGFDKVLPKIHVASVYYGDTESSIKVGRWWYRGKDLYKAYDTAQIFTDDQVVLGDEIIDFRSTRTLLSPFFLSGQKLKQKLQLQLDELNGKKNNTEESTSRVSGVLTQGLGSFTKLTSLLLILIFFYIYFQDENIINQSLALTAEQLQSETKTQTNSTQTFKNPLEIDRSSITVSKEEPKEEELESDFFIDFIKDADVNIGLWHYDKKSLKATLTIQRENEEFADSLTLDDLRVLGWIAIKRGDFIMLRKEGIDKTFTYKLG